MFSRAWSSSALRVLLAVAAAVVMSACGSAVEPVTVPEPVAARADEGGGVAASAVTVLGGVPVASCDFVNPTGYGITLSGQSLASTSGNETLQCRGTVTPAPPGLEFFEGFPCYMPQTSDWTSNSQLTVRANGSASLTCKAK
jgi:hypothetical protein